MRRYIRHPTDMPIEYALFDEDTDTPAMRASELPSVDGKSRRLRDLSQAGLSFSCTERLPVASPIRIKIPCEHTSWELVGRVRWCHANGQGYLVGVVFDDVQEEFRLRMVEQLCSITQYQQQVLRREGRALSYNAAANEWIEKYAGNFPG